MSKETIEIVAELKDLVSGKFKEINAQIAQMEGAFSSMNNSRGGGIMGQVLGANLLTGALSKAGSAAYDFGREVFNAYGKAEQFQVSLKTLLYGNEQQAKALNNQLKAFAIETPFELTEIQQGTKMMIAYGSSAGSVVDEMRMLGDIGAGVGSPLSDLAYLYGTLRTQGIAYTRDLNQFTNRGIPVVKELAKQFHVTDAAVRKLVEDGKVGFADFEKAFRSMTSEGGQFHNMMVNTSGTLLTQASNLSDAWDQLKIEIGESQSGILKGTVSWVTAMVQQMLIAQKHTNFQYSVNKNVKGGVKMGFEQNPFNLNDNEIDKLYAKYQAYQAYHLKKNDNKAFSSFDEYKKRTKNDFGPGLGTEEIFKGFANDFFDKFQTVTKENTPLAAARFQVELSNERENILKQLGDRTISSELATSKFAVLNDLLKETQALVDLQKLKAEDEKKEPEKPKNLEEVAKANRATQINVNVENLVREYTNYIGSAEEAKKMTVEDISKVFISLLNDATQVAQ